MKNNRLMPIPDKMPMNMSEYLMSLDTAEAHGYNRALENADLRSQAYNFAVINSEGYPVEKIIEKARKIEAFLNPPEARRMSQTTVVVNTRIRKGESR